jgi:2-polyprenyl-6-methoxyphenol hydroxylase-like FAD-dependent oxidoreductase
MPAHEPQLRAPVIVAGAGPTGLTLATELRRGGIDVLLLEQRSHRAQNGSRAARMQPRTVEMLDQRGVVDRFLAAGPPAHLGNFAGMVLDYSNLPTRSPTRSTSCRPRPNRFSRTSPPSWASRCSGPPL